MFRLLPPDSRELALGALEQAVHQQGSDSARAYLTHSGGDVDALPSYFVTAMDISALDHMRMVAAVASPHVDVLGHCTGRLLVGRGRPQSEFDADVVIEACRVFDTALEIN